MENKSRILCVVAVAFLASGGLPRGLGQVLLPDMIPLVREDVPYLANWDVAAGRLRVQTMFANVGDGLMQIRADSAGQTGATIPVVQRVFSFFDNGATYEDFPVGSTLNFHEPHGHIHLEDFSEFQLRAVFVDDMGNLGVGDLVANEVKTSFRLHDSARIPGPEYDGAVSYASSNTGLFQNVSVGWGDIYSHATEGQSISLDGVPVGPLYWLRQIVDPLNHLREKDETNNSAEILIDLNRPGKAVRYAWNHYIQPGDKLPPPPGDLTLDGNVDLLDWQNFQAGLQNSLAGLDAKAAYLLGDLDLDGQHTLNDPLLFRIAYDAANGAGAFAALQLVPEPGVLALASLAFGGATLRRRRIVHPSPAICALALGWATCCTWQSVAAHTPIWNEDFASVALGPNVDESLLNATAWTDVGPAGWSVDDSGVPGVGSSTYGVAEWEGWSFADKEWWSAAAGDQNRSEFALGNGVVAVADSDEWDDLGSPAQALGFFNAWMRSPAISLNGESAGSVGLSFASSWRDECCDDGALDNNDQTAVVRASYDQGANFTEILRWESHPLSPFFKNDAPNEIVTIPIDNPDGANDVILEFGLLHAGNDWWWAIDNLELFVPSVLEVDVATGQMTLQRTTRMTGYEIVSPSGSLVPDAWLTGNLAAQGVGADLHNEADLNHDGHVDNDDVAMWEAAWAMDAGGDVDGDLDSDGKDFLRILASFGQEPRPGDAWETLLATDERLIEFFLHGDTTLEEESVGAGYHTISGQRDLVFRYTTSDDKSFPGAVRYVDSTRRSQSTTTPIPEPATLWLVATSCTGGVAARRCKLRSRFLRPHFRRNRP